MIKKRPETEKYEKYWNYTAAFTDIFGEKFSNALRIVLDFIDSNKIVLSNITNNNEWKKVNYLYKELQIKLINISEFQVNTNKDSPTTRKIINQFVKLGFINPYLNSYHNLCRKFLLSDSDTKKIIYSKILLENSSLASSVSHNYKQFNHLNFFLNTLEHNKKITYNDLSALMLSDINYYKKGYITRAELNLKLKFSDEISFIKRKYNQINHLKNALKKFVDLSFNKDEKYFYFKNDKSINNENKKDCSRNPARYRIYKNELHQESKKYYNNVVSYLDRNIYKIIICSHIKPSHNCIEENNESQAYDYNNGILLNQDIDAYFDKNDLTFSFSGEIIFGNNVPEHFKNKWKQFKIDKKILNKERLFYLSFHHKLFLSKNNGKFSLN